MGVDRQTGPAAREDRAHRARRHVVGDDALNVGLAGELRSRLGHFVDEQVGADKPVDRLAHEPRRLEAILAETRRRGFGQRDPSFVGGFYGSAPQDDGLAAIALPLLERRACTGPSTFFG